MLQSTSKPQRQSVNTSIDSRLISDAKALGINISRAAEEGKIVSHKTSGKVKWYRFFSIVVRWRLSARCKGLVCFRLRCGQEPTTNR